MSHTPQSDEPTTIPSADRLEALARESAENLAGWQRARADYQNLKREWETKQTKVAEMTKAALLREILPIYDHLRAATETTPDTEHTAQWITGIRKIREQLDALFKKMNVARVPTIGVIFDPHLHEPLKSVDGGSDIVVEELQGGYSVGDELIYPAKVIVGSDKKTNQSASAESPPA